MANFHVEYDITTAPNGLVTTGSGAYQAYQAYRVKLENFIDDNYVLDLDAGSTIEVNDVFQITIEANDIFVCRNAIPYDHLVNSDLPEPGTIHIYKGTFADLSQGKAVLVDRLDFDATETLDAATDAEET
jgi:hypothetical protein